MKRKRRRRYEGDREHEEEGVITWGERGRRRRRGKRFLIGEDEVVRSKLEDWYRWPLAKITNTSA
jgi:alkanesulfonate monooxygenase SsuD/methylene tetrahydromethanopterin reductase-like flavin-dependent oxidoreductase (luciferase family)